jgi:hypothetical protein
VTLNELRYIVAVAQARSFGRAAAKCFVSQPALSVAIQKLEEELGAPLFERGKNEVTPTPVGARVVAYRFEGRRYDCGRKLGYLEATVALGLKHPETKEGFARFLADLK